MRGRTTIVLAAVVAALFGALAGPAAAQNPNLPGSPVQFFKNAEGASVTLFGPVAADVRLAITSLTLDGGQPDFGTQVAFNIMEGRLGHRGDPPVCSNTLITTVYRVVSTRQNRPVHLAFPVPLVLPTVDPGGMWCLKAAPVGSNQVLILGVGYVVEPIE